MHTCYLLKEKNTNKILTDHIQLHGYCPPLAYVEIPKFDKNSNIRKELKNWILFLKSNKEEDMSQLLKEDTIFEKAIDKYNYFTDNKDLLNEYDRREAFLVYQSSIMRDATEEGFEKGIKKGKLEGLKEGKISMAIAMKKDGADINLISKYTGLSLKEIRKLRPDGKKP